MKKQQSHPRTIIKALKAELKKEKDANAAAQVELTDLKGQVSGFTKSQTYHESELTTLQEQVAIARAALRPIAEKTKDWSWPNLEIQVWKPLSYGDIKRAADAAVNFP